MMNKKALRDKTIWEYAVEGFTDNYFDFSGRATRKEFWSVYLAFFVLLVIAMVIVMLLASTGYFNSKFGLLLLPMMGGLVALYGFIPVLSVGARRLHDLGHSGWWMLAILILSNFAGLGIIWQIVIGCLKGEKDDNRFGEPVTRARYYSDMDVLFICIFICLSAILLLWISYVASNNANNQSKFPNHAHQTNTDNNNHAVNEPSAQSSVQKPAHIAEQNKPIIYINTQLVTTKNVHIRQCPSKKYCASIGIVPNQRTVLVMPDKNRNMNYYEDGWFFVEYSGHFCFLHNYNQQGCHLWNENIRVNGWIYHEGLSELRTPNNQ